MKKVNLNGKLSFKKETIAKLNDEQMNVVKGGTVGMPIGPTAVAAHCAVATRYSGCPGCNASQASFCC